LEYSWSVAIETLRPKGQAPASKSSVPILAALPLHRDAGGIADRSLPRLPVDSRVRRCAGPTLPSNALPKVLRRCTCGTQRALVDAGRRQRRKCRYSARRSRFAKSASQAASICIGVPHMRIEDGPRPLGAEVLWDSNSGGLAPFACPSVCGAASPWAVPCRESTTRPCRTRDAGKPTNQHFTSSRVRHAACDPGCAAHTALAEGRHSA